jgi:hypothetical protein
MEKTKMNYQNGKIYTIRSYQTDDVYYGSTTQPLSKRLSNHKSKYKQWQKNKYRYVSSFEVIKYDDCYIELHELYPCNSKTELEKREGQVIRENDDAVNRNIAGRTDNEYYNDNINKIKAYRKQYCVDNHDKIQLQSKQYREANKEKIKLKGDKYRMNNLDKINEKNICRCGGKYTYRNKSEHLRSKKHIKYILRILNIIRDNVHKHAYRCHKF